MATMDKIEIVDLLLRCIIGVNDDERHHEQDVNINITLFADLRKAGQTDHLDDTVNYRSVKKAVIAFVEDSSFFLLETLADGIARICLREELVERVVVRIEKPGALRFARTVAVEIARSREDVA